MTIKEALSRTLLLMRTELDNSVTDDALLAALTGTSVAISIGDDAVTTQSGQSALVAAASLMARSGHLVWIDAPETDLAGPQPPLIGDRLVAGLDMLGRDLLPDHFLRFGKPPHPVDLSVTIGQGRSVEADATLHLAADDWATWTTDTSVPWPGGEWPIGGLAAGALAAGEAFKCAMRRLANHARDRDYFAELAASFAGGTVQMAPTSTVPPTELPVFDIVSGGAIANAMLFTLYRLPGVIGRGRVLDDDSSALSNLNRNALLVRSALEQPKVTELARLGGSVHVDPVLLRYQEGMPLAETVLIGVDDIPSRWAAQRQHPRWLGVGATEGFAINISEHVPGAPCAGCLHPTHLSSDGPIPTAAFISFWSGLQLIARWLCAISDIERSSGEQQLYGNALRLESWPYGLMPVSPNPACPVGCNASAMHNGAAADRAQVATVANQLVDGATKKTVWF